MLQLVHKYQYLAWKYLLQIDPDTEYGFIFADCPVWIILEFKIPFLGKYLFDIFVSFWYYYTVEVAGSSPVWKEHNFFCWKRKPETLAIWLISLKGPMRGKAVLPYTTNFILHRYHGKRDCNFPDPWHCSNPYNFLQITIQGNLMCMNQT